MNSHQLALALRAAYLAMHRRTNAVMAEHGVTADQFVLLEALLRSKQLIQKDLVQKTSSDHNTVRAMVQLLARRGLVVRKAHPDDGRAQIIELTSKGRRVAQQLWKESRSLRRQMQGCMSTPELDQLVALLQQLTQSLQTQNNSSLSTPSKRGK